MEAPGKKKATKILMENSDKPWVQRILNYKEGESPVLQNEDGTVSTHSMAWGQVDDKYIVYPTVLMGREGKLQRLSDGDAIKNARETGNFIPFDSEREADWFSRKYKLFLE